MLARKSAFKLKLTFCFGKTFPFNYPNELESELIEFLRRWEKLRLLLPSVESALELPFEFERWPLPFSWLGLGTEIRFVLSISVIPPRIRIKNVLKMLLLNIIEECWKIYKITANENVKPEIFRWFWNFWMNKIFPIFPVQIKVSRLLIVSRYSSSEEVIRWNGGLAVEDRRWTVRGLEGLRPLAADRA